MSVNGQLLAKYYRSLVKKPVPLVPFNPKALKELATLCEDPSITPAGIFSSIGLAGPQSSQGWASVEPGPFTFPDEHGPHWKFRNEWYYLACNLTYGDSKPLFVLLAIIRRGTVPNNTDYPPQQLQVVGCEATLEIPGAETPYITTSGAFDGMDTTTTLSFQAPSPTQPFSWSAVGTYQNFGLQSSGSEKMFPMHCGIIFNVSSNPVSVQLTLNAPTTPEYFLQGEKGCAPCIDGIGYRYYSWPALTVSGTVVVNSTTYTCSGQGWLDHQWGSRMQPLGYVDNLYIRALSVLSGTYTKTITPQWDWFFVHLSNGMHITSAVLPSQGFKNGSKPVHLTNTSVIFVDANNNLSFETFQNGTVVYSNWVNVNCNLYASTWVLKWGDDIDLVLTVAQPPPAGFSQGVDGQTFMEKGVTVAGTVNGTVVTGTGFAEAIGYDSIEKQILNMLVPLLPSSQIPDKYSLFLPANATAGQIALASLIVIVPPVLLIILVTVLLVVLTKKSKRNRNIQ
jgi:predicted secreted hydrolase